MTISNQRGESSDDRLVYQVTIGNSMGNFSPLNTQI